MKADIYLNYLGTEKFFGTHNAYDEEKARLLQKRIESIYREVHKDDSIFARWVDPEMDSYLFNATDEELKVFMVDALKDDVKTNIRFRPHISNINYGGGSRGFSRANFSSPMPSNIQTFGQQAPTRTCTACLSLRSNVPFAQQQQFPAQPQQFAPQPIPYQQPFQTRTIVAPQQSQFVVSQPQQFVISQPQRFAPQQAVQAPQMIQQPCNSGRCPIIDWLAKRHAQRCARRFQRVCCNQTVAPAQQVRRVGPLGRFVGAGLGIGGLASIGRGNGNSLTTSNVPTTTTPVAPPSNIAMPSNPFPTDDMDTPSH